MSPVGDAELCEPTGDGPNPLPCTKFSTHGGPPFITTVKIGPGVGSEMDGNASGHRPGSRPAPCPPAPDPRPREHVRALDPYTQPPQDRSGQGLPDHLYTVADPEHRPNPVLQRGVRELDRHGLLRATPTAEGHGNLDLSDTGAEILAGWTAAFGEPDLG